MQGAFLFSARSSASSPRTSTPRRRSTSRPARSRRRSDLQIPGASLPATGRLIYQSSSIDESICDVQSMRNLRQEKRKVLYCANFGTPSTQRMRDTHTENPRGPVLIVDGDRDYTAFVVEVLQRAGFASHVAATGPAAVSYAREHHPAAVILDVILPDATGYELCRQLRDEHADAFPIVFVTGERTEPSDRVVGLLIGADDYLVKPIDADELIARLRRLIARSSARAARRPSEHTSNASSTSSTSTAGPRPSRSRTGKDSSSTSDRSQRGAAMRP